MTFQQQINAPGFALCTPRLRLAPLAPEHFAAYRQGMDAAVTRYQYPDPFPSPEAAAKTLSGFCRLHQQGRGLFLAILEAVSGDFLGAVEVSGTDTETPEIGLWLCVSAQGRGYGFEALCAAVDFCRRQLAPAYLLYEVDQRNVPSIRLVEKLGARSHGCERVTTPSGKTLLLEQYHIGENT